MQASNFLRTWASRTFCLFLAQHVRPVFPRQNWRLHVSHSPSQSPQDSVWTFLILPLNSHRQSPPLTRSHPHCGFQYTLRVVHPLSVESQNIKTSINLLKKMTFVNFLWFGYLIFFCKVKFEINQRTWWDVAPFSPKKCFNWTSLFVTRKKNSRSLPSTIFTSNFVIGVTGGTFSEKYFTV